MWLDDVKFDEKGLVPVIAQRTSDGKVMMLAWANREALEETARTGRGVYFSRSRGKLWRKGEESGNVQIVKKILLDCDGDAVSMKLSRWGAWRATPGTRAAFTVN